uniref:NADH-ubiquinone oxidoreductase chain 3 n=1 Tax=Caecilius quercus TaxID=159986 RepID=Q94XC9_9NEOP|nr:NADH dehydrogenase subunit 3 [Caecilius quercus]
MLTMYFSVTIVFLIANLLMSLCMMISKKNNLEREKMSPFECGFEQKSSSSIPFSLHFFLITIIFLIFDVEIALIVPSISIMSMCTPWQWLMLNMIFIMILLIGLFHEWNQNMLEWTN